MIDWKDKWPERVSPSGQIKRSLSIEEKTEVWVYRAKCVHGDIYDYSPTVYLGSVKKLDIMCPKHGLFSMKAHNHLTCKQKCPSCAQEQLSVKRSLTEEEVLERFEKTHGSRYDYSKVQYTHILDKVTIICKEHGEFLQSSAHHMAGQNCPSCCRKTSNILYILQVKGSNVYKIGITTDVKRRLYEHVRDSGKELEILLTKEMESPREAETHILNKYTGNPYKDKKFQGYSEYRTLTELEVKEICEYLEHM